MRKLGSIVKDSKRRVGALAAVVAVAVPAAAVAGTPPAKPASPGKSAPKVTYVLHGTLSAYTAANGATPGSVTIAVTAANYHARSLKGQSLTFAVAPSTKVVLDADGQITDGEKGVVKVRAPKRTASDTLATTLQAAAVSQVVDQADSTQG